jgi:homoserine dehydrogenase
VAIYNIALIGFGSVNRAFAELIDRRNDALEQECGFRLQVVGVSDRRLGSVISSSAVDPRALAEARLEDGGFLELPGGNAAAQTERVIKQAPSDIVVEATHTDGETGEPAIAHCKWALAAGRHVVTTNKGPVALAAAALRDLASRNDVAFEYEGSVMSGTPVLRMARTTLSGSGLTGFEGILNGTSNYVLDRMEKQISFADAIKAAQRLGFAEANPVADIEGHDVRLKVVILANELLGASLKPADVKCRGISSITQADVEAAKKSGERWKLVGSAMRKKCGGVSAIVEPKRLSRNHPLAEISGVTNAIAFDTDLLGTVTVTGPGAGRTETAFAILADIIAIHRGKGAAAKARTA